MKSHTLVFGLLAAIGLALPALAAPRDDVLEGMSKCSAVADNAARLACYDALKPQLDAALRTPPPPVASTDSGSTFGLDHVFAGGTSDKPQTKPEQFGSERLPPEEQAKVYPPAPGQPEIKEIDSVTATLTEYAHNGTGRFIVFLDNGQVWQQVDTDPAHFRREPKDNTITIGRGFMGSYSLQINGEKRIYKVKRLK